MREGGRRGHQGCGYDARAQPRAARGMPRSEGRRPASDGADVAQRAPEICLFRPLLYLPKMEVARPSDPTLSRGVGTPRPVTAQYSVRTSTM